MSSDDNQSSEDFSLEIDGAVESFFSRYEENAPKMDDSSNESESDTISEEENAPETDDSSLEPILGLLSEDESAPETDDSPNEAELDTVSDEEKAASEENISGSGLRAEKKFDPTDTFVFKSLTEAVLTVDWEVNDANVNKAREIIEKIQTDFPTLKETRAKKIIDGMLTTLDSIAASPQRVSTSATAQLEKAIPILRGIAAGAEMEDGYEELIEDAIAGLEACCKEEKDSAEGGGAESLEPMAQPDSPDLMTAEDSPELVTAADSPELKTHDRVPFDNGEDVTSTAEELKPIVVPAGVSRVLDHHSKVVAQLAPRARRLADLYAAAQGSENVQELIQKICGLLELQTRALQDVFSLNCGLAVFPMGKIKNLSDFFGFQFKAMHVCVRYARDLEKVFKKQPHRKRFWQSIYLLRIAVERQIDELSRIARGKGAPVQGNESTVSTPLSVILRENLLAMEECMERAGFIAECEEGCDHNKITEAGRLLREKIAHQIDILRRSLG